MMGPLYLTARLRASTRTSERFMLARFDRFCTRKRRNPLAHATLIAFLESRLPFISAREIYLEARAIRRRYIDAGLPDPQHNPLIAAAILGLQRRAQRLRKIPLVEELLKRIIDANRRDIIGARDIAIIHLLFEARLTMIQICNLRLDQIERRDFGCRILLASARGKVRYAVLRRRPNPSYCAVAALERWLDYTRGEGLVFKALARRFGAPLQPSGIGRIIEGALRRAGLTIHYAKRSVLTLAAIAAAVERGESDAQIGERLGFSRREIITRWRLRAALHLQGATQRLGL